MQQPCGIASSRGSPRWWCLNFTGSAADDLAEVLNMVSQGVKAAAVCGLSLYDLSPASGHVQYCRLV